MTSSPGHRDTCRAQRYRPQDGGAPGLDSGAAAGQLRDVHRESLGGELEARLSEAEHRFCLVPACPVVYFGREERFHRDEIVVPVFQKEPAGDRTVCYCFDVSEADIRREIAQSGRSTAAAEITGHVQAERCACEIKNPQGSCCLGNVAAATREAADAVSTPR